MRDGACYPQPFRPPRSWGAADARGLGEPPSTCASSPACGRLSRAAGVVLLSDTAGWSRSRRGINGSLRLSVIVRSRNGVPVSL
jgi:hypothetical protein